jgi:putative sigma-54 modulation protein
MELQVVTRNLDLPENIREYAVRRMEKLKRYLPTINEGKLEFFYEDTRAPKQRFVVQITIDSKGTLIRAQRRDKDIRSAFDGTMDALASRIERYKGKLYDKGRGISLTRQGTAIQEEETERRGEVVKNKHFVVKPMSEDEAISQMDLLGHKFFLYLDADTNNLNLLYQRDDGNYGLIKPQIN